MLKVLFFFIKFFYFRHAEVSEIRDTIPLQGTGGAAGTGIMKMMGLRKSTKQTSPASSEGNGVRCKKIKKIKVGLCKFIIKILTPSVLLIEKVIWTQVRN